MEGTCGPELEKWEKSRAKEWGLIHGWFQKEQNLSLVLF